MLFNSIAFLGFFAVVFSAYHLLFNKTVLTRNLFLVVAGYFFYGWWDVRFLILIIFSSVLDFVVAQRLEITVLSTKRKGLLLLSLLGNLGILMYFKYSDLFPDSWTRFPTWKWAIPVGISFYTFQSLAYTIDVYRGKQKPERQLITFLAYIAFFPQLVAGPIERAKNLLPQLNTLLPFNNKLALSGIQRFLWGLLKKVVIADNLAPNVNWVFENQDTLHPAILWAGLLGFGIQIYCDFSGYTDMAIGSASILGFRLTENFKRPYFSRNLQEFWHRWHITLSQWFRDYVYIPLGGSKKGTTIMILSILITFMLSGLWHGSHWRFIVWGGLHGVLFLLLNKPLNLLPKPFSIIITFLWVTFLWVFFRSPSMEFSLSYIGNMFSSWPTSFTIEGLDKVYALVAILFSGILLIKEFLEEDNRFQFKSGVHPIIQLTLMVFVVLLFGNFNGNPFIYFQF